MRFAITEECPSYDPTLLWGYDARVTAPETVDLTEHDRLIEEEETTPPTPDLEGLWDIQDIKIHGCTAAVGAALIGFSLLALKGTARHILLGLGILTSAVGIVPIGAKLFSSQT